MNRVVLSIFIIAVFSSSANAEIVKKALMCETQICFYWWPKLPAVAGWHQDEDASYQYSANALAPDGSTFSNARAVMYANAIYKPRVPTEKTRDEYIASDLLVFKKENPNLTITHLPSLKTEDGQALEVYAFSPGPKEGNWEVVAYGEEDEFYLTFVVSAKSKDWLDAVKNTFNELVSQYREKP